MTASNIFLFGATISAGLMAGLFYSYSCSVMPGLSRLSDDQFVAAMQSINRAIQNPFFFISFVGVVILLPLATYSKYSSPASATFYYLVAATVIYFTGTLLVTAIGNIPLNNSLDKFDIVNATKESISNQRILFEKKWNSLNLIRTISSLIAFICTILACLNSHENNVIVKP